MASHGLPYMGSKDSIVHKVCSIFPKAENFYDLFGGGFSISHYMLLHRKNNYSHFHYNEIAPGVCGLIKDAIAGKYNYKVFKPPFITREDFFKNIDDAYTRILWSFGNSQRGYLFGKEIEEYKRSLHNAVIFDTFDTTAIKALGIGTWPGKPSIKAKRFFIRKVVKERVGELQQLEQLQALQQLERLERLQRLQRLQQLERLQRLQRLEFTSLSYEKVKIKPNSVIYCDPPYKGTAKYLGEFDHDKFWQWVMDRKEPVYVSEYTAPKHVKVVMAFHKNTRLSLKGCTPTDSIEKVFANEAGVKALRKI